MIYAIHKETKKHRLIGSVAMAENEWELVQADAEGWTPHDGGECPLADGAPHEVKSADGAVMKSDAPEEDCWDMRHGAARIIAYRPILDAKPSEPEAAEWAVGERCVWQLADVCMGEHVILAKDGDTYWIGDDHGGYDMADREELRPIRSEEDRLVEQALKDISAEPDEYGADSVVYRMIKAGYRKAGGDT